MSIKKYLLTGLAALSLFAANNQQAFAASTEWVQSGSDWYLKQNGSNLKSQWYQDSNGKWYWLNESGKMVTDWKYINGKWYRFNDDGAMLSGWSWSGGSWYYLNGSGAMETNWFYTGGYWYYANDNGAMQKGVIRDKSNTVYATWDSGEMRTGTFVVQGLIKTTNGSGAIADTSGLTISNSGETTPNVERAMNEYIPWTETKLSKHELDILNSRLDLTEINKEFLKIVNAERATKGLPPYRFSDKLIQAAMFRTRELAEQRSITYNHVAHTRAGSDSKPWQSIFSEELYFLGVDTAHHGLGELLASNVATQTVESTSRGMSYHDPKGIAQLAYEAWRDSPEHYKGMMYKRSGEAAIGVWFEPDMNIERFNYKKQIYDAVFSTMTMEFDY